MTSQQKKIKFDTSDLNCFLQKLKENVLVLFNRPFSNQHVGQHCHLACVPVGMLARISI